MILTFTVLYSYYCSETTTISCVSLSLFAPCLLASRCLTFHSAPSPWYQGHVSKRIAFKVPAQHLNGVMVGVMPLILLFFFAMRDLESSILWWSNYNQSLTVGPIVWRLPPGYGAVKRDSDILLSLSIPEYDIYIWSQNVCNAVRYNLSIFWNMSHDYRLSLPVVDHQAWHWLMASG